MRSIVRGILAGVLACGLGGSAWAYQLSQPFSSLAGGSILVITNCEPDIGNGTDITRVTFGTTDSSNILAQGANWVKVVVPPANSPGEVGVSILSESRGTTFVRYSYVVVAIEGDPLMIGLRYTNGAPEVYRKVGANFWYTKEYFDRFHTFIRFDSGEDEKPYNNLASVYGALFTVVTNTMPNAWRIESVWNASVSNAGVRITQIMEYQNGRPYFRKQWRIANTNEVILTDLRLLHGGDTFFANDDSSSGYFDPNLNMVYLKNPAATGLMGFYGAFESPADQYCEDDFMANYFYMIGNDLPNTVNSNFVDAGYSLQWNRSTLAPGEEWVVSAYEKWTEAGEVQVLAGSDQSGFVGSTVTGLFTVVNFQSISDTFTLTPAVDQPGWTVSMPGGTNLTLDAGKSSNVLVEVAIGSAMTGAVTLAAMSQLTPGVTNSDGFSLIGVNLVLAVSVDPAGAGETIPAPGDYPLPLNVATAIQASAHAGYHFVRWAQEGGGTVADADEASTTVSLASDSSVTATFALNVITALTDRASLLVQEGYTGEFQVRLSAEPTGEVSVTVARTSGDADLTVSDGATLTFTTANWADDQTVTLAAAEDNADNTAGEAEFSITAPGITGASLTAYEVDDDYVLTVIATNGTVAIGAIDKPPRRTLYDRGTVLSLTATPDESYMFGAWSGDASDTNNPIEVTMDADKVITAEFVPDAPSALPPRALARKAFTARWRWVEGGAPEGELSVARDEAFTDLVTGYEARYVCNDTECGVTNLTANQDYWYRVRRITDASGESAWSEAVKARTGVGLPVFSSLLCDAPVGRGSCQEFALSNLVSGAGVLTVKSSEPEDVTVMLTTNALFLHYFWKGKGTTARITMKMKHPETGYQASYEAVLSRTMGPVAVVATDALTNAGKRVAQEVTLENRTGKLLHGVRLKVDGLKDRTWMLNRSGFAQYTDQQAILEVPCVWPAGSQMVVRVVYRADYVTQAAVNPVDYWAGAVLPPLNDVEPVTFGLPIMRSAPYDDGALWLLGLPVIGNRFFSVSHSDDDGATWILNVPAIRATANDLMWLDRDEEAPANRLYRVVDAGL